MTTIATDGKSIAADTMISSSEELLGYAEKLFETKDGGLAGFAGSVCVLEQVKNWLQGHTENPPEFLNDTEFEGLILRKGRVFYMNHHFIEIEYLSPNAVGSGASIALGAMLHGANPREAVQYAIERDLFTGGTVTILHEQPDKS